MHAALSHNPVPDDADLVAVLAANRVVDRRAFDDGACHPCCHPTRQPTSTSVPSPLLALLRRKGCERIAGLLAEHAPNEVRHAAPSSSSPTLLVVAPLDASVAEEDPDGLLPARLPSAEVARRTACAHLAWCADDARAASPGALPGDAVGVRTLPVSARRQRTVLAVAPPLATRVDEWTRVGGRDVVAVDRSVPGAIVLVVRGAMRAFWMHTDFRKEQILDKTPYPAPGVSLAGGGAGDRCLAEASLRSADTREEIRVCETKPSGGEHGYCPLIPLSNPKYRGVLADTRPLLTEAGPKGANHKTPRLLVPRGTGGVRRVEWCRHGPREPMFFLKIGHSPPELISRRIANDPKREAELRREEARKRDAYGGTGNSEYYLSFTLFRCATPAAEAGVEAETREAVVALETPAFVLRNSVHVLSREEAAFRNQFALEMMGGGPGGVHGGRKGSREPTKRKRRPDDGAPRSNKSIAAERREATVPPMTLLFAAATAMQRAE